MGLQEMWVVGEGRLHLLFSSEKTWELAYEVIFFLLSKKKLWEQQSLPAIQTSYMPWLEKKNLLPSIGKSSLKSVITFCVI